MTRLINRPRRPALVAAVIAAVLPTAGCQTLRQPATTSVTSTTTPGGPEPAGPKTEFHREVSADQEFNVHVELARFHETQGNHEAAVVEYQKATEVCEKKGSAVNHAKLGPEQHSLAQRRMAAALDRLGRFAQAEPHYLKALKLTPGDSKVWNDAGYSYYLQNRLPDAERTFKTADALDPNNPRVLTNLGLTLAAQGKNDEALAALSRAGGPAIGHANFGYIMAAMGKTDLAREHYQSAIALQPELTAARHAIAKLDAAQAKPATAVATAPTPPAAVAMAPTPSAVSPKPAAAPAVPATRPTTPPGEKDQQLSLSGAEKPAAPGPGDGKPAPPVSAPGPSSLIELPRSRVIRLGQKPALTVPAPGPTSTVK